MTRDIAAAARATCVVALAGCSVVFDFDPSALRPAAAGDARVVPGVDAAVDALAVDVVLAVDVAPADAGSLDEHEDAVVADLGVADGPAMRDTGAAIDVAATDVPSVDVPVDASWDASSDAPWDARSPDAGALDATDGAAVVDAAADVGTCDANLANDPDNCGRCAFRCGTGMMCVSGRCFQACTAPESFCAGRCVDLAQDPRNCGVCGVSCTGATRCCNGVCLGRCG